MNIKISATVGSRHSWPNGKPVASVSLPDGRVQHTLEDGRLITVSKATHVLDYESTFVGAKPGATYSINVALSGNTLDGCFYEVWNFDINELRHYAFSKTVRLRSIATGDEFSGQELEQLLIEGSSDAHSNA